MVKVGNGDRDAARHKRLNDLDPPDRGDASFALPPFKPRRFVRAQIGRNVVNEPPSERNISHSRIIGQIVQTVKPTVSKDSWPIWRHDRSMTESSPEAIFNEALCARVHRLRNDRGWTSQQMATALGVPPDRYRKYEYRSPLPPYLMERFALIVGCDVDYLVTGKYSRVRGVPAGAGLYENEPDELMEARLSRNAVAGQPQRRRTGTDN